MLTTKMMEWVAAHAETVGPQDLNPAADEEVFPATNRHAEACHRPDMQVGGGMAYQMHHATYLHMVTMSMQQQPSAWFI